jgi:ketosteroid isomerase-like protein
MKRSSIVLFVVIVGIATAAMSQEKKIAEESKKAGHAEDLTAVNQLSKDYAAAWAKGDPELLLACYADDAVVIMSHEDPIVGKEALRELYQHVLGVEKTEEEGGGMAAMAEALGLEPVDYIFTTEGDEGKKEVSGDLGYLWSTYATVATPKPGVDAEPIRDSGVSLLIVRRQEDGAWRVALMMATRGEDPVAASQIERD